MSSVPSALPAIRLGSAPGPVVDVLPLGAALCRLEVTCGDGERRNVLLGYATEADYAARSDYMGAVVGRYANRISRGTFDLQGRRAVVGTHDRGNSLHGGPDGFDRRHWDVVEHRASSATLELVSPDGDQGFPGTLTARVTYSVDTDSLALDFEATTDAPTVVNLTSHAYLNLDGDGSGTIDDHVLAVAAGAYTPVDDTGIPTGDPADVTGTPFDLRPGRRLGDVIRSDHPQVRSSRGIDHNLVLDGTGLRRVAVLESGRSLLRMELDTDQPGLQVYTGNFLDGSTRSSAGVAYRQGDGLALEPQRFPDTPNRPDFGSALLLPGERYSARSRWRFSLLPAG